MELGWALVLTLVLVLVTAFFVAAEYSLVRVRETQLAELTERGSAVAALGQRLVRRIDEYISATQVGITGANLGLGIVGEPAVFDLISRVLRVDPGAEGLLHALAFIVAFTVVTFVTIVIGELAQKHPFTRYPVFREDLDNVIGVVHVRDLVGTSPEQGRRTRVTQVMRRVVAVPETLHLDRALAEMRRQRIPLFLVIDEFGGTAGLVTMEDVLEELVGELQDEFDKAAPLIRKQDDGSYLIDGLTSLDDLRERLNLDLTHEPYDTVGGLVFGKLGRLARIGDSVDIDGWRAEVTAMDGRRVAQVRIRAGNRPGVSRSQ